MKIGEKKRFSGREKEEIMRVVEITSKRSEFRTKDTLMLLGISYSRYIRWKKRKEMGQLEDRYRALPQLRKATEEEIEKVKAYALSNPKEGYRRLAWMMVDEDIAYLTPSMVYKILKEANLLSRWKRSQRIGGYNYKPKRPDEQWHTDIMYIYIKGRWYFFVGVLDSYSRFMVHWDLLMSMDQRSIKGVIEEALERNKGKIPRIVHDNGSQFISKEWRKLMKEYGLEDIRTRKNHPESNGKIERFHRNLREGISEKEIKDYWQALKVIEEYVKYYNEKRLHAGIRYLRPADYYRGNPEERLKERREKLAKGLSERIKRNMEMLKEKVS